MIQTLDYEYVLGRWIPVRERSRSDLTLWRGDDLAARPVNGFFQASLADVRSRP